MVTPIPTCGDQGFDNGTTSCPNTCQLDESDCWTCGDSMITGPEECDGTDFGTGGTVTDCTDLGYSTAGTVGCAAAADANACTVTGCAATCDGTLEPGEDCDGTNFLNGDDSCATWDSSNPTGTVTCDNCQIDTASCTP